MAGDETLDGRRAPETRGRHETEVESRRVMMAELLDLRLKAKGDFGRVGSNALTLLNSVGHCG